MFKAGDEIRLKSRKGTIPVFSKTVTGRFLGWTEEKGRGAVKLTDGQTIHFTDELYEVSHVVKEEDIDEIRALREENEALKKELKDKKITINQFSKYRQTGYDKVINMLYQRHMEIGDVLEEADSPRLETEAEFIEQWISEIQKQAERDKETLS